MRIGGLRVIVTSVGFGDFLALTLAYNRPHWDEVCVLTSPQDLVSQGVAVDNKASFFATDAFYERGATFNKFAALERCLDWYGRFGVMCFADADCFWPKTMDYFDWKFSFLYSFRRRRLLYDVTAPIPPEADWPFLPLDPQTSECMGFAQIFHAHDPVLKRQGIPWHRLDLNHAALGDSAFQALWPANRKVWLDYDILHLGDYANNWLGRVVPYRDGTLPEGAEERLKDMVALKRSLWPNHPHPSERWKR